MKEIIKQCKCGVFLEVNEHRDYYEKPEQYLINQRADEFEIPKDIWQGMVDKNIIMRLQFYPYTPIGFYVVWHYDYDELIKSAKEILKTLTPSNP